MGVVELVITEEDASCGLGVWEWTIKGETGV